MTPEKGEKRRRGRDRGEKKGVRNTGREKES